MRIEEFHGAKLTRLSVLKTFGSPKRQEKGYFVLPDGSGSIMNFYNGKQKFGVYSVPVYGRDHAVPTDAIMYNEGHAFLPVWGIVRDGGSVLAGISGGEALANIQAYPGDEQFSAYANAVFRVRELSKTSMNSTADNTNDFFYVVQDTVYPGDLVIEYAFYEGKTDYNELAKDYGERLFGSRTAAAKIPATFIEFIGSCDINTSTFGFKYQKPFAFTTLRQVIEIGNKLLEAGVSPLVFKLTGFFNGGVDNAYLSKVRLCDNVGTEKDLRDLIAWSEEKNVPVYFDFNVQTVKKTHIFDGYSIRKNASFFINRLVANKRVYNPATRVYVRDYVENILNAASVESSIKTVWSKNGLLGKNLSLRDIGTDLSSNFRKQNAVERQTSLNIIENSIKEINRDGARILTNGANQWVLPYAQDLLNVPVQSGRFDITDGSTPFLQLVIGSRVSYTGVPLNLNTNTRLDFLRALETGSGMYFTVAANETNQFVKTGHKEFFATGFSNWEQTIIDMNKKLKEIYKDRQGAYSGHARLAEDVYKTSYDDGFYIIVNKSQKEYDYNGRKIPAMDYITGREGDGE